MTVSRPKAIAQRKERPILTIFFDPRRRVIWAMFSGAFTRPDCVSMDEVGKVIAGTEGPLTCVFDFAGIDRVEVTRDDVVRRTRGTPIPGFSRIIVAPRADSFELAQLFSAAHSMTGSNPPLVMRDADELRSVLDLDRLGLEPVDPALLNEVLQREREGNAHPLRPSDSREAGVLMALGTLSKWIERTQWDWKNARDLKVAMSANHTVLRNYHLFADSLMGGNVGSILRDCAAWQEAFGRAENQAPDSPARREAMKVGVRLAGKARSFTYMLRKLRG